MSPAGWPKGKPRGPYSPERLAQYKASAVRRRRAKMLRQAALAAGAEIRGVGAISAQPAGSIGITAGAFRRANEYVGDCEFVEDGLDECLIRAVHNRLVYAGSVCVHHESPFQDVTIEIIAATERHHMKLSKNGPDPRKQSLPLPAKGHLAKRALSVRQLELIGLLAMGLSRQGIAQRLGIQERTVKMHCDVLRVKLGVANAREIPFAYREKTGKDPFSLISGAAPVAHTGAGTPLVSVVDEMFTKPGGGKPLLEVVSAMFDS